MKIAHMALWTRDLERQARFWVSFFDGVINEKYCSKTNPGFESYFVNIGEDIAIELMTKPGLTHPVPDNNTSGWVHLALSVGGAGHVDALAIRAKNRASWSPDREPPVTGITRPSFRTPTVI